MKLKLETAWVDRASFGFGWTLYALFVREFEAPIGMVWGMRTGRGLPNGQQTKDGSNFAVYHSFVLPWARRQGVRRKINTAILEDNDTITTLCGATAASRAFLRKDYQFNRELGVWVKTKKAKRKR